MARSGRLRDPTKSNKRRTVPILSTRIASNVMAAISGAGGYNQMMSLVVVGSVAYDGVETPHGRVDRMLGGACTYIALSASFFTQPKIVAVVGDDFEQKD